MKKPKCIYCGEGITINSEHGVGEVYIYRGFCNKCMKEYHIIYIVKLVEVMYND